ATADALARARSGHGPTLLEMVTYRIGAHSTSDDPRAYRQQTEVDPWIEKDPIARFRTYLTKQGLWSGSEDEALRKTLGDKIAAAIARAEAAPAPTIDTIFNDVLATKTSALEEQEREAKAASPPTKAH